MATLLLGYAGNSTATQQQKWPGPTYYTVVAHPGDTVAAIGRRYSVSSSVVAKLNGLAAGTHLPAGRVLLIPARSRGTRALVLAESLDQSAPSYATPPRPPAVTMTLATPQRVTTERPASTPVVSLVRATRRSQEPGLRFSWPIVGPVISSFGPGAHGTRNDGINIAAAFGAPFFAAADGTVSYAGSLRGYGNLILISHADGYVTAYAHAANIAVTRGEEVAKGQLIGTAGQTGGVDRPQLHFEIRRGVKAIDPGLLLAANS